MTPADLAELKWRLRIAMATESRRKSQCEGKQAFDNRVTAGLAMRSVKMRDTCTIFRCDFCGHWHVGSQVEGRKKEKAKRMVKAMKEAR